MISKNVLLCWLYLATSCWLAAQISGSAYFLEKNAHTVDSSPFVKKYLTILVIKNTGKSEVVLPKANLGPAVIRDRKATGVYFSVPTETVFDDIKLKPSFCEFLPVKLEPGESMAIRYDLAVALDEDINDVIFHYDIPPQVAKEWGFAAVALKVKLVPVKFSIAK